MRDYFIHPAQTNLELYAQAIADGYDAEQRKKLGEAYLLALQQVFPLARGSGKPFIAHLVGTASLVLASGCPPDWVIAALLHALYQRRIPFQGGLSPAERRDVIAQRFGSGVDDLIDRYTEFEAEDLSKAGIAESQPDVLTLRLADELEDLGGYALALHAGESTDCLGVRGSYAWRRHAKTIQKPTLLSLSSRLGLAGINRGFSRWLDFSSTPDGLNDMKTGWVSSVSLEDH